MTTEETTTQAVQATDDTGRDARYRARVQTLTDAFRRLTTRPTFIEGGDVLGEVYDRGEQAGHAAQADEVVRLKAEVVRLKPLAERALHYSAVLSDIAEAVGVHSPAGTFSAATLEAVTRMAKDVKEAKEARQATERSARNMAYYRLLSEIAERVGAPVGIGFDSERFRGLVMAQLPREGEASRALLLERAALYGEALRAIAIHLGLQQGHQSDTAFVSDIVARASRVKDQPARSGPLYRCAPPLFQCTKACGWRGRQLHASPHGPTCPECYRPQPERVPEVPE